MRAALWAQGASKKTLTRAVTLAREHDVPAVGQRLALGLEVHPPHNDRVPQRVSPELSHLIRQLPRQPTINTDDPVLGHRGDKRQACWMILHLRMISISKSRDG